MTNDTVKNEAVIEIASCSVSIVARPIEIKIPHEEPKVIIPNLQIIKPIHKIIPGRLPVRAVDNHKGPGF